MRVGVSRLSAIVSALLVGSSVDHRPSRLAEISRRREEEEKKKKKEKNRKEKKKEGERVVDIFKIGLEACWVALFERGEAKNLMPAIARQMVRVAIKG